LQEDLFEIEGNQLCYLFETEVEEIADLNVESFKIEEEHTPYKAMVIEKIVYTLDLNAEDFSLYLDDLLMTFYTTDIESIRYNSLLGLKQDELSLVDGPLAKKRKNLAEDRNLDQEEKRIKEFAVQVILLAKQIQFPLNFPSSRSKREDFLQILKTQVTMLTPQFQAILEKCLKPGEVDSYSYFRQLVEDVKDIDSYTISSDFLDFEELL